MITQESSAEALGLCLFLSLVGVVFAFILPHMRKPYGAFFFFFWGLVCGALISLFARSILHTEPLLSGWRYWFIQVLLYEGYAIILALGITLFVLYKKKKIIFEDEKKVNAS